MRGARPARPLLHNMCCVPRTQVRGYVAPLHALLVRFDLGLLGDEWASRAREQHLPRRVVARARRAWREAPFGGAVLVFSWLDAAASPPGDRPRVEVRVATDPPTVLNVLGRARGSLLLPRWPLSEDPAHLLRSLASDDPRLVALVERTGWEVRP